MAKEGRTVPAAPGIFRGGLRRFGEHRYANALLCLSMVLTTGLSLALMVYARPLADDLCIMADIAELGALDGLERVLTRMSSRWAGKAIEYALFSTFDPRRSYGLLLFIPFLVFAAGLTRFVWSLCQPRTSTALRIALVCGLYCLYWAGMRSPAQSQYWFPGAVGYHVSIGLALLLIGGAISSTRASSSPRLWRMLVPAGLAVFVAGTHELVGVLMCVFFSFVVLGYALQKRWPPKVWIVAFAAMIAGLVIVMLVPGGFQRLGGKADIGIATALRAAVSQAAVLGTSWVVDGRLMIATLLVVVSGSFRGIGERSKGRYDLRTLVPIASIALLATGFFLPTYLSADTGLSHRIQNLLYLLFLLGWFSSVIVWAGSAGSGEQWAGAGLKKLCGPAAVVLAIGLLTSGNSPAALKDLLVRAPAFAREVDQRSRLIQEKRDRGERNVRLARRVANPASFHLVGDVRADPNDWRNLCAARFFELDDIAVAATEPNDESFGGGGDHDQASE